MRFEFVVAVAALLLSVSSVEAQDDPAVSMQGVVRSAQTAVDVRVGELSALVRRTRSPEGSSSDGTALVPVVALGSSRTRTKGRSWIAPSYEPTSASRDPRPQLRPPSK